MDSGAHIDAAGEALLAALGEVVSGWPAQAERRTATELRRTDFEALHGAGFTRLGLPLSAGGLWRGAAGTVATCAAALRTIAAADPSVALVAAMHPLVLAYWNEAGRDGFDDPAWRAQCDQIAATVADGHWWGTLTSEPGSGGDIELSRATTRQVDALTYLVSGEKHFGSGSGITSYMITTARVQGWPRAVTLFMDVREQPWTRGDARFELLRAWDGYGMTATQSHAFILRDYPATRMAVPDAVARTRIAVSALGGCLFTAVIMGILDAVLAWCRDRVVSKGDALGAFERVGLVEMEQRRWLAEQAFTGMLRSVQSGDEHAALDAMTGKLAVADLAENLINQLARVASGSAFSRSQPLLQWAQDVRALGFLRPPWPLAYQQLLAARFEDVVR